MESQKTRRERVQNLSQETVAGTSQIRGDIQTLKFMKLVGPQTYSSQLAVLWRRQRQPTPVLLPGKSHGRRSLAGFSRARLSGFPFTFHFHALEKEMATHSRVLAWRIPGTGEPSGLPSLGSHRVGHDWRDSAAAAAAESAKLHFWDLSSVLR